LIFARCGFCKKLVVIGAGWIAFFDEVVGSMAKTNPVQFFQQVRAEIAKVVWPTRNETLISTIMVLIMVFLASMFFLLADQVIAWFVQLLLSIR